MKAHGDITLGEENSNLFREMFRRSGSHHPSGVAILAGFGDKGEPFGLTISTLTFVSVEPALVSFCINNASGRIVQLRRARHFSVNLLMSHQRDLAKAFSTSGADPFQATPWRQGDFAAPLLEGMFAILLCEAFSELEAGDHRIIVGQVKRIVLHGGEPLVYWRHGFHPLNIQYPFLESETALNRFVRDWETGVLPRSIWTHAAHIAVAAYYAFDFDREKTFERTKAGILRYNACVGTANTEDSGYHETLTRFWAEVVCDFVCTPKFPSRLEAVRNAVRLFGQDRDRHRLYYCSEVLHDRHARRNWIPPHRDPFQQS